MKTMDSWARRVKGFEDVPESFHDFVHSIVSPQDPFPHTIFAPPEKCYRRKNNPKLVCLLDDRIYIAEKNKKQITSKLFLLKDIYYVEYGSILLLSWFKIHGLVDQVTSEAEVEFNTVVEAYFRELVDKIRTVTYSQPPAESSKAILKKEQHKFDYLVKENYKYMNFGRRSMIEGEEVQQIVFQPEIQTSVLKYFHRTLSFAHMLILTDQELVLIKDDDRFGTSAQARYGGIWNYIPFNVITNLTIDEDPRKDAIYFKITLLGGTEIRRMLNVAQKPELESLMNRVYQLQNSNLRSCI